VRYLATSSSENDSFDTYIGRSLCLHSFSPGDGASRVLAGSSRHSVCSPGLRLPVRGCVHRLITAAERCKYQVKFNVSRIRRTFGLKGRQASASFLMPYIKGSASGTVFEERQNVTRSGLADC